MLKLLSGSEEQTKEIAGKLGALLSAGDVVCLFGNLGAGKTVFAAGISSGLGITDYISSPTFTIVNEYAGRTGLYHFDVYRINTDEFFEIGGDEYFSADGVVLVEWPENIRDALPKERLEVYINYDFPLTENSDENYNEREIIMKPYGNRYEEIIRKLSEAILNN